MKKILTAIFFLVMGMVIMGSIDYLSASNNDRQNNAFDYAQLHSTAGNQDKSQPDNNAALKPKKEVQETSSTDDVLMPERPITDSRGNDSKNNKALDIPSNPSKSSTKLINQSKYLIDVNISEQKVRIYENGQVVQEWIASTGEHDSTPLGEFVIQNRGEWFFSEKYQQGGKWWVSFKDWGVYLFHSVPMDRQQNILVDEADKLGSPASHGCIRLREDNAKWIYDHIPEGTPVNIHN